MPKAKTFRPVNKIQAPPDASQFNNLCDNVLETFSSITPNPLLSGKLLGPFTLTAGTPKTIAHGLGFSYTNLFLCVPSADGYVHQLPSPDRSQWVVLQSTADMTLQLYVF